MKIYVASSWRNLYQQGVVRILRAHGHEVYDFRNPPNGTGFGWRQLGAGDPQDWSPLDYREILQRPRAQEGFNADMDALKACDACVLVLPCGRSAHLELGWATGAGKRAIVLCADTIDEPELMYLMCERICVTIDEVLEALGEPGQETAAQLQ